ASDPNRERHGSSLASPASPMRRRRALRNGLFDESDYCVALCLLDSSIAPCTAAQFYRPRPHQASCSQPAPSRPWCRTRVREHCGWGGLMATKKPECVEDERRLKDCFLRRSASSV